MRRITTGTRELNLFGPGKDGFKNGDLANAILPTDLNADWFNQVQEELANFVETAGIVLDGGVRTQLVQALRSGALLHGVDSGTANARVVNYTPAVPALVNGMALWFQSASANTGAVTLNINGLGARPVLGLGQAALQGGEIVAGGKCQVVYASGSNSFVLVASTGGALPVGAATKSQHAMQFGQATGRLLRTLIYTRIGGVQNVSINGGAPTPVGAGTYVPDAASSFVIVEVQGGGNAGAGATLPAAGNISLGSPGGAGAYGKSYFTAATVGASQVVTVGAAGAPVSGAAGGAGGSSSFGALLSSPGGVGSGVLNNFPAAANANGNNSLTAAPTGANLLSLKGGCSNLSLVINTGVASGILGGPGGISLFGVGGVGVAANTTGSLASGNWGSGGGGVALTSAAGASVPGGAATDGVVIVQEFA